ncbi:TPA: oligopeptide ABC transporter substrate-binding protein [Streptococcus suis]|nr:oligopeptide ABC transporter substrate-binding protein [Streptococcus suis]
MKKMKKFALAGVSLLSLAILAACQSKESTSSIDLSFESEVTHEGQAISGGQFKYALVASAPSTGILLDELAQTGVDAPFASMVDISMFGYNADRKLDDSGLAKAEFDVDAKTVTVSLTGKDYKWSDGQPFTIDDYIFTIEQLASPDYTGVRADTTYTNIVGFEELQAGTASEISGVKKVDDYTVVLTVKEMSPSMMYAGGGVPELVMPKHIFKDIAVKDWESSDYARTDKVVGMGPYKVKEIVSGESVTYEPNEYYFKGKVKLDSYKIDIVSPDTIVSEMKAGNYDLAEMPTDQYESYKDLSNITLLGSLEGIYNYIGFNLGKYDEASGKNVTNPDAKMNNVKLRQAMGYALDNAAIGEKLYNGLYHPTNSLIISFFGDVHDADLAGYSYDPEKAKQLLDEAGYKDVDGDGIREDANGKPLKISVAAQKSTETQETMVQQYLTWWKEIGLNVELYTGRTIEYNTFYESIAANDEGIDVYLAAWIAGLDPDPTSLWGPEAMYNYTRFVSDENTTLLNKIASAESFDEAKNIANYKAWQEYAFEQAFAIPTLERESITAVNKRVKYYDVYIGSDSKSSPEKIELTAEKGVAAQ